MRCARCNASGLRASEFFIHRKSAECKRCDPWYNVIEARKAKNAQLVEKLIRDILYPSNRSYNNDSKKPTKHASKRNN